MPADQGRRQARAGLAIALALSLAATLAFALSWLDRAFPPVMPESREMSQVVVDRHDRLLRAFTVENGRWRLPVKLDEVDPLYLRMLITYEDRRFFDHAGVDPRAVLRAAWQFLRHGRIVSGGSTITMQLARLLEPREERSLAAKLRQALRALQLERRLSKREILEAYLALAPYGGNLEGIRAASYAYFGKEPGRLLPREAALLVALPQSPEARRPDLHPERALAARNRVLALMAETGALPEVDAVLAGEQPLGTKRHAFPSLAAHSAARARELFPQAPVIRLTIDRDKQAVLEQMARDALADLPPSLSVALLLADHQTGEVVARVGSPDFASESRRGFIDMTRAVRSPGSALKPFIYGLAFEDGIVHPSTLIDDKPSSFGHYRPTNFDLGFQGTVTVAEALQMSLNIPAVTLLSRVGPQRLLARMRLAGVRPALPGNAPPGLAIALGGLGLTLEDLVTLYTALPRGGRTIPLTEIAGAPSPSDDATDSQPVMSEVAAWYVTEILRGTTPPEGALTRGLAYKTGTSYGYRDAWSVGYDSRYVLGVWVGRADGTAVPGIGGRAVAAPLLFSALQRVGSGKFQVRDKPRDAFRAATSDLPLPMQHLSVSMLQSVPGDAVETPPVIVYPPNAARIDLSAGRGSGQPLALKIQNGAPPFRWLVNGTPMASDEIRRSTFWEQAEPGFSTVTVIDARGRSDTVTVFVE